MKILLSFSNQNNKSNIIAPFLSMNNCEASDNELIIPGMVKIDYSGNDIKCFCLGFSVVEKILSNICEIEISHDNNIGNIKFPSSLNCAMMQSKIIDFKSVMDLCSSGKVEYINTNDKKIKATVQLSQWINANIVINGDDAFINLYFLNYQINVTDGSATKFCERVKEHPLISAGALNNYFNFGKVAELEPVIDYICFWKILKSENGYKKYSNFINECNDKLKVEYDEGKKYKCQFDGGKVEFQLLSIGDKYPKKVVLQMQDLNLDILNGLTKQLNFNTIDLVAKVSNLKISTHVLLNKLNFYKDDDFFIFTNVVDNFKATYDIYNNTMNIKQEFKIQNIDKGYLENSVKKLKEWIDVLINIK